MIRKFIAIFITGFMFMVSFVGLMKFFQSNDNIDLTISIVFAALGVFIVRKLKKKNKVIKNVEVHSENVIYKDNKINQRLKEITPDYIEDVPANNVSDTNKSEKKYFKFRVAGVTKKNENNENVQTMLKEYVSENVDEKYNGLTNKEILEDYDCDDKIYETSDVYGTDVEFVYEPDNPFDSNAIKIYINQIGHVGYVPKTDTHTIKNIIDNHNHYATWEILGGKYKYIDEDEDKVRIETDNYGIEIEMSYS